MGLLTGATPLSWEETSANADHVRNHGVQQFVKFYKELREKLCGDVLKWGDEIEYNLVKVDHETKSAQLLIDSKRFLDALHKQEEEGEDDASWHIEFGAYMIEGTPGGPYESSVDELLKVQENMRKRRLQVEALLGKDEMLFSLTAFPRIGCPGFTFPSYEPQPLTSHTRSLFWPSEATTGHHRYRNMSKNIRCRRGQKVSVQVPIFKDENTVDPVKAEEAILKGPGQEEVSMDVPKPWHIYMDAMGFGHGLSCLQITFQACNVGEAKTLYDQLTPMCPIMQAMTASAPIYRGYLADIDCRWDVLAESVDDRTKEERGEVPIVVDKSKAKYFNGTWYMDTSQDRAKYGLIDKSRYSEVSTYISECVFDYKYNDKEIVYDKNIYKKLLKENIEEPVAKHVAHLFIRDTVSLFEETLHPDDENDTDQFENIQSTNWQTMRFKPPPPNSKIGWRVEFRPCDLQVTDFENAAVCCFIILLTRVVMSYKYNLLIPISMVQKNMRRAQKKDAILDEKFFFRTNISTVDTTNPGAAPHKGRKRLITNDILESVPIIEELTINEIFNGSPKKGFPGLLVLIREYLSNLEINTDVHCVLTRYLSHLSDKAAGKIRTNARFMRDFVRSHPEYNNDSIVTNKMTYDLLMAMDKIQKDEKNINEHLSKVPEYSG